MEITKNLSNRTCFNKLEIGDIFHSSDDDEILIKIDNCSAAYNISKTINCVSLETGETFSLGGFDEVYPLNAHLTVSEKMMGN